MNISSGSYSNGSHRVSDDWARSDSNNAVNASKEASVAQSTTKVVQEALSRAMPSVASTPSPSAQLAVDPSRVSRLAGADKSSDAEKLDKAKLDEIKAKIESGEFEFDYGAIAQQLVQVSMQQKVRR